MPRKKGVSLKRTCPQRSEPDAMDLLNEGRDDESSSLAEKNKVMVMAQEIKALEEERDFLRQTVLKLSNRGPKKDKKKVLDTSTECSTSDTDEDSLTSSSSSESPDSDIPRKKRRRGHKKKIKRASRSKSTKHSSRGPIMDRIAWTEKDNVIVLDTSSEDEMSTEGHAIVLDSSSENEMSKEGRATVLDSSSEDEMTSSVTTEKPSSSSDAVDNFTDDQDDPLHLLTLTLVI
ncbi:coiled-coil domain-containing protein 106-like [Labeo rohita]|uniref:Coiled-coil domain-containing protein 106-like n=1 Tax=Labeo rohita TaxID=84645 RepID=A0A498LZI3_LABRO|nr:coiled-coil domain-containing protein 106-like [Labeo rohita]